MYMVLFSTTVLLWHCVFMVLCLTVHYNSCLCSLTDVDWDKSWGEWEDGDQGGGPTTTGGDEDSGTKSSSSPQPETSWLSECIIAASSTCDIMAVAYKNRLVILTCKYRTMIKCLFIEICIFLVNQDPLIVCHLQCVYVRLFSLTISGRWESWSEDEDKMKLYMGWRGTVGHNPRQVLYYFPFIIL